VAEDSGRTGEDTIGAVAVGLQIERQRPLPEIGAAIRTPAPTARPETDVPPEETTAGFDGDLCPGCRTGRMRVRAALASKRRDGGYSSPRSTDSTSASPYPSGPVEVCAGARLAHGIWTKILLNTSLRSALGAPPMPDFRLRDIPARPID
jgi:hypothetical protein